MSSFVDVTMCASGVTAPSHLVDTGVIISGASEEMSLDLCRCHPSLHSKLVSGELRASPRPALLRFSEGEWQGLVRQVGRRWTRPFPAVGSRKSTSPCGKHVMDKVYSHAIKSRQWTDHVSNHNDHAQQRRRQQQRQQRRQQLYHTFILSQRKRL